MTSSTSQMTPTVFERSNRSTTRNQLTYEPENTSNLKKVSSDPNNNNFNDNNNYSSNREIGQNPKIVELMDRVAEMENRLHNDFSLSEASKYSLKKEIAKSRANIMRLKRVDDTK